MTSENNVKLFFNRLDYLKNSNDRIVVRRNLVKRFLGDLENVCILDIGCGDGSLSLQFLKESNRLTLVDISENMIAKVRASVPLPMLSNVRLINDSFDVIANDEKFDVILCIGVIAHVPTVDSLFAKIQTVLSPNGILILETTPNPYPIGKLLSPYYFLRDLMIGRPIKYKKNRLKVNELMLYAHKMNWKCLKTVRYSIPLPSMSHWPQWLKLRYTLFTLNNSLLSRFGSEHIFMFKKNG